jgi:hypothetical protein
MDMKDNNKDNIGKKYDDGKLDWSLLPMEPVEAIISVLQFGAGRYGRENWKMLQNARERYYSACMRHLSSWRKGEDIDPDSDLPHLAHAMCNLVFLHYLCSDS